MPRTLIHYILPTCNPDIFFKNVIGHLDLYIPLKDIISFGINFQPPWTTEQIDIVKTNFRDCGLDFRYTYNIYTKEDYRLPLFEIRQACAKLNPTALYYCIIDDDIEYFCSADIYGKIICNSIQYMEKYNAGTLVLMRDTIRGVRSGIIERLYGGTWTCLGNIVKNIYEGTLSPSYWAKGFGNNEDITRGVLSILNNYEVAVAGVNIGNHTLGYKAIEEQVAYKYGLQACNSLPGTISHYMRYAGNRFLSLDLTQLCNKKRLTNIKPEFINYTTPLDVQLNNLALLISAKALNIIPLRGNRFNPYNFINYNIISSNYAELKLKLLDNLYLFRGVSEFCSFSIWGKNFTTEQILTVYNYFYANKLTVHFSTNLAISLNDYAIYQETFSDKIIDTRGTLATTLKILDYYLPHKLNTPTKIKPFTASNKISMLIDYLQETKYSD